MNARLQVEHPVTEMVTGLDLVELQLRVAAGEALPDLSQVEKRGHAIEARVYAEDPAKGFIPKPGPIDELSWAGGAGEVQSRALRVESGVKAGNKVTPFYDPMVAKLVAWGETREGAIVELDRAIAGTTARAVRDELAVFAQGARERGVPGREVRHEVRGGSGEALLISCDFDEEGAMTDIGEGRKAIVAHVLGQDGEASLAQRRAAFDDAGVAGPVGALVGKIAQRASAVTDEDIAATRAAGVSEDQVFEVAVCAAVGQATRQYEAGLTALDAAVRKG